MKKGVRLAVLGSFEARWSTGEPLELGGKKAQALLAYLAVERARPHARERLATLLWGQMGEERARHNLRQALSKIRGACGELIVSEDDSLRLDDERCDTDVREFDRLAGRDDPEGLDRAVALYRGDLIEGLAVREPAFDDWLRGARTRLRDRALAALERLAERRTEQERFEDAMEHHRRRLVLDPACEPAHRGLMELLARTGRRSDALRQYQHCKDALERELGAEPSAETSAAYERIRDRAAVSPSSVAEPDAPEPPSVAVLPFENLSGEEQRYFVDGITEDITTQLSRFGSLLVIARQSAFVYRDRDLPVQQIGRELGARYVVQGSVRRAGARVRINVQLVDAKNGRNVWAERFDREVEDVFLVQDEVTATVVSTLAGRVEASRLADARRMPVERLDAYDYVLRGKELHHRFTAADCEKAIEMFERAIEKDPDFAAAHSWLACGLGQAARNFQVEETEALMDRARLAAERGLELDEEDSECHRVLAQIYLLRHDLPEALSHGERALFLNPNDDRSVAAMGEILSYRGRHELALTWVEKAIRLNPYHPESFWLHLGRAFFHLERYEDALSALDNVTRPKLADLAYRAAASACLDDASTSQRHADALRRAHPDFDAERFVRGLPYEREADRAALLDAFRAAGL